MPHTSRPMIDRLPEAAERQRTPRRDDYWLALIAAVRRGLTSGQVAQSLGKPIRTVSADMTSVRAVLRLTGQLEGDGNV